jgi:hypothetical protein
LSIASRIDRLPTPMSLTVSSSSILMTSPSASSNVERTTFGWSKAKRPPIEKSAAGAAGPVPSGQVSP